MALKIAKFAKVSFKQFLKDFRNCEKEYSHLSAYRERSDEEVKELYDSIELPRRATKGSAGYDFFSPINIDLAVGETIKIPTGIRCFIDCDWVLKLYPRSGQGFKYRLQLDNTVGIIDSDYYYSDNEGHMMAKLTADIRESSVGGVSIKQGQGYMQGIFIEYGITEDDKVHEVRNGGFGSTDTK